MYVGLTKELCEEAVKIVYPTIFEAARGVIKRPDGFLVILNPTVPWEPKYKGEEGIFQEVVLLEEEFGNVRQKWEHPYDAIARSKAFISWKTGLSARQVQLEAPYLYEVGMTKYGGSAVGPGGLVVAYSGVEEYFDQMISEMMLAAIKGVCLHEMHKPDGVMEDEAVEFIGI